MAATLATAWIDPPASGRWRGQRGLDRVPVADVDGDRNEAAVGAVDLDRREVDGEDGPATIEEDLGCPATHAAAGPCHQGHASGCHRIVTPPSMR
jgi:hypothetical protein